MGGVVTVGFACDLDAMQILLSVNGNFLKPEQVQEGLDLKPEQVQEGLYAALSGRSGKVRYNLGEVPFNYAPPSADYRAFTEFA